MLWVAVLISSDVFLQLQRQAEKDGTELPLEDLPAFRGKIVYAAVTARFERTRVANIGVRGDYYVEKCCRLCTCASGSISTQKMELELTNTTSCAVRVVS